MHLKPILHTLLLIFIITILGACSMGDVDSAKLNGDTLTITSGKDVLLIKVCRPDLLQVDYHFEGEEPSPDTLVIDSDTKWDIGNITSSDLTVDPMIIKTTKMTVKISKKPCRLSIYDSDGKLLLKEQDSEGVYKDGVKFIHNDPNANFYGISGYDKDEDSSMGLIRNSGGKVYAGYQGHCGAPMVFTTTFGLLVDSDGGYFDIKKNERTLEFKGVREKPKDSKEIPKKNVKYYIAVGQPKTVLSAISAVTGRPPMLPRWADGFMNSEWGIDEVELVSHVNRYRATGTPIDVIISDYDYKKWGTDDNYGEFKWNDKKFPLGPSGDLKTEMDKLGIKMGGIMKPRLVTEIDGKPTKEFLFVDAKDKSEGNWWYSKDLKVYLDWNNAWCKDLHFANPNVRDWFWKQNRPFLDTGIRVFFNDEADIVSGQKTKKEDKEYKFSLDNFQFLNMQRAFYEGQTKETNLRACSLNRNFYPGAQRYGYVLWSGDVVTGFPSLAQQRERLLSAVNVGQVKWTSDGGGFKGTPTPQNYARWLQFATFSHILRVHGDFNEQRQPWASGSLTAENAAKEAIRFRYELIPYIYHYERKAFEEGIGLDQPLFYQYPNDPKVANKFDTWFFGDSLIVAPIVEENQTSKQIYLPNEKTTWIDYFRGTSYKGGTTITYPVNAVGWNDMPVFVRKGAIIPRQEPLDYIGQKPVSTIYVEVFPDDSESNFEYYEDDGVTTAYKDGTSFFKQKMSTQDKGATGILFSTSAKTGSFAPDVKYYIVKIHGRAGKNVTVNGLAIKNYSSSTIQGDVFTEDSLADMPNEGWTYGKDVYGDFTCVKIAAGTPKDIVITGIENTNVEAIKYEAEKAALLWADKVSEKPSIATSTSGQGYIMAAGKPSAAASFTLNTMVDGAYGVILRYENGATPSSKAMDIYVNGYWIQALELPATSPNTWQNKVMTLPLAAGRNTITFKWGDTNAKLDYITVPLSPQVAKYEAESAQLSGNANKNNNHLYYTGWGFVDNLESQGAKLTFKVYVSASGTYDTAIRYANAKGNPRTLSMLVNGVKKQIKFPDMANWDTWGKASEKVTLTKGENTFTLQNDASDTGSINIDHIQVSKSGTAIPATAFSENLVANGDFETGNINGWKEWHDSSISEAVYGVDSRDAYFGDKKCYFFKNTQYKQSIHQTIPTQPGVYLFSAWVKLNYNKPKIAQIEFQANGSKTPLNIPQIEGWQHLTREIKITTEKSLDIGFYVETTGNSSLQIDGVQLVKHQ